MELSARPAKAEHLLVCFDYEGSYGMPYDTPYDLASSTQRILDTLAAHNARAVFFVVGRLAEKEPQIVEAIVDAGHEIGLHGYDHHDLGAYGRRELLDLDRDLARVESLIEGIGGTRPECFRAPYLLGPHFYRAEVYAVLRARGYKWISNREVRYPVELLRPGRFPLNNAWRLATKHGQPRLAESRLGLAALNVGLLLKESFGASAADRLRWLLGTRAPFVRDGIVEVPLYSPLDCDLVGLPTPDQNTPPELLAYARAVTRTFAIAPGPLSMITFHDWIVGSGNRLGILDEALASARRAGTQISGMPPHIVQLAQSSNA
jgi:peptidoglycan/xylan/chitin deacetylase (PgdA/CDA1 family)